MVKKRTDLETDTVQNTFFCQNFSSVPAVNGNGVAWMLLGKSALYVDAWISERQNQQYRAIWSKLVSRSKWKHEDENFKCSSVIGDVIVSYACWCLVFLSPALCTLLVSVEMLLRGLTAKWIKWGLLTEYISNLWACNCGLRHLQGLWLLLRLWIHQALPAPLLSLLFRCGGRVKENREREKERALDDLLCLKWVTLQIYE